MREIECTVNPDGTIEVDMINYKGKVCEHVAEEIAKALGKKTHSKTKDEYYVQAIDQKQKTKGF